MSAPIGPIDLEVDDFDEIALEIDDTAEVLIVAVEGEQGPQGPAGDGGFTHTQSTPAATWTIPNTLGRYPASVLIVVGTQSVEADIEFPDISTIAITFASPTAGRAEIL